MKHLIIDDSDLSIETLLNSRDAVFTKSEANMIKKSPWTWYSITKKPFDKYENFFKDNNFHVDVGYAALSNVIDLDKNFRYALKKKSIHNLTNKDINIDRKINELDELSRLMAMPKMNLNLSNLSQTIYTCKMRGFEIASLCQAELFNESVTLNASASGENRANFSELLKSTAEIPSVLTVAVGSYVKFIESKKTSAPPTEINVLMAIKELTENKYYELMQITSCIADKEIRPIFIPYEHIDGYAYFDIDINRNSRFVNGNETIFTRDDPAKLLRVMGGTELMKLRSFTVSDSRIQTMRTNERSYKKIYLAIKQSNLFYWMLKENGLGSMVEEPPKHYMEFEKDLSFDRMKQLLAASSIELSKMTLSLNDYITHRK